MELVDNIPRKGSFYVLTNVFVNSNKYLLPLDDKTNVDRKMLEYLFNIRQLDLDDEALISVLNKKDYLINFSCPVTSRPNEYLDNLARVKMLSETHDLQSLNDSEIYYKSLNIPDDKVVAFLRELPVTNIDTISNAGEIEGFLIGQGVSKNDAVAITNVLIKDYSVDEVTQLQGLADETLKKIISKAQVDKTIFEQLNNSIKAFFK